MAIVTKIVRHFVKPQPQSITVTLHDKNRWWTQTAELKLKGNTDKGTFIGVMIKTDKGSLGFSATEYEGVWSAPESLEARE